MFFIFFFISVATMHRFIYSGQEWKKFKLLFMILTYLWPWNKIKVIKPGRNCKTPSKVITTQFERSPLNSLCQKASIEVLVKSKKDLNYLPSICARVKKKSEKKKDCLSSHLHFFFLNVFSFQNCNQVVWNRFITINA